MVRELNEKAERESLRASGLERSLGAAEAGAAADHEKLAGKIKEMDAELKAREARLKAIIGSVSYKLAAPTRDIERLVRRIAGAKPEPKNGLQAPQASSDPAPDPQTGAAHPSASSNGDRRDYAFHVDHPRTWSTSLNQLLVLGWVYERSGIPILGVRARIGDQETEGAYGARRPDVLAATGEKASEYSQLKISVPVAEGEHLLVVEVQHSDGWHPLFERKVRVGLPTDPSDMNSFERWCEVNESLGEEDKEAIANHIESLHRRPMISVVMPVFNPSEALLNRAISSVVEQVYPHWELCISDDASTEVHVRTVLERFAIREPRIKVVFRPKNGHICAASNSALAMATGEFVALMDHDDELSPLALYEVAAEINAHPDAQLIYSDEDKVDLEGRRFDPYFKPDWNPDLFLGQNYISHFSVYKTELVRSLGGFRPGFEGSQDWDLTLRVSERVPGAAIRHVPRILYHWRAAPGSTALQLAEKNYPLEAARRALVDHFSRQGECVELLPVPGDHWRAKYPVPAPAPLVSLIIPTKNAVQLVSKAVASILEKTDYPNFEIVVVDNGSDDPETLAYFESIRAKANPRIKVTVDHGPFNYSAINNRAVSGVRGEIVGFLNNDIEAISPDWLSEMVSQASRPGIGAVGAMLYYPDDTIQHAGVVLGLGGVAGHPFKDFKRGSEGQMNRLRLVQNFSAVTAACMLIRRDRFLGVGGFNETDLPVAFNDVDLCCKLVAAGFRNLWTPFAEFYHHESATRGMDHLPEKRVRFRSEIDYMLNTWGDLFQADPAYNPNLTLVGEDFSPSYITRTAKTWLPYLT
jgi:glycosyltransferase involved in cell wall biosynthesis